MPQWPDGGQARQVNVFISQPGTLDVPTLLVLPTSPGAAIPQHLRSLQWDYFATIATSDALIGASADQVEDNLARDGYALVPPNG